MVTDNGGRLYSITLDSSTTNYDPSTGVVEFNVDDGSGVLMFLNLSIVIRCMLTMVILVMVRSDVDQTMGVYLDMGLGLSSALIPSSNTVTSPESTSIILASNVSIEKTVEVTVQNIEGQNKYFFDGVVEENFELIAVTDLYF